jgi:hypothetical protein
MTMYAFELDESKRMPVLSTVVLLLFVFDHSHGQHWSAYPQSCLQLPHVDALPIQPIVM